ncbi:MAG: choice-of-anchor J domain-containing protein, partial [Candidatus Thermoplasmatota archaeon]|nr:choice-of-anchor J domain-containing protein [Candidatus Thermoplasmatota archaeon]
MKPKHINKKLIRTTTSLFAILMAIFMVAGSGVSSIIPDVANETTITGTQSSVIANALDTEGRMPLLATNAEQQSTPQPIDRDITVFSMDFDGTWVADPDPSDPYMVPATGWDVDGICTAAQSGYPALTHYWSQFDDATYPIPHQGGFAAGLWWSDGSGGDPTSGAQDEWIITPSIDCTGYENLSLSFYSVYTMSSYGAAASAHDYIQVSTDGGTTWTVVADLVHDAAYYFPGATGGPGGAGWNWNEYPPVIDMSAYDGVPSLMIAFNYLSDGAAPRGIWAVDTMELYQVEYAGHDTGVTDIIAPVSGPAAITTPEVTVSNFVPTDEEDAPVNVKISKLQKDFLLTEDFEDAIPSVPIFPPVGWSIIQTDPVSTWYKYSTGYARCQETGATGAQDEWLITQTFDCSALTSIAMEMGYHYMGTPSVDDYVEILGSTDNGATWPYMIDNLTVYSSGLKSWDISTWAAGQSQVKLAWRYVSGPATGSHYFYFRQFKLSQPPMLAPGGVSEDFNGAWGPYGDNPPTGWTIIDLGSQSPPVWDTNDWHKYYYSTFGSDCARVYYTPSPYEQMDEWLITPTVDCSSMTEVSLLFRQYFYFYTTYPGYGEILGSTDNG